MTSTQTINRLAEVQKSLCDIVQAVGEADYRTHYHPDLSPLGWHLGHCAFVERYWLEEVVLDDNRLTASLHTTYFPELAPPKHKRGATLPHHDKLLAWCRSAFNETCELLNSKSQLIHSHSLCEDDYLQNFLLQHHCQHYETMHMALLQRMLKLTENNYIVSEVLTPAELCVDSETIPAGSYSVGTSGDVRAYDNELQAHSVKLDAYSIARRPVTNAEYLMFMNEDGYRNKAYWSKDGWQWREGADTSAPEHWRKDEQDQWFEVGFNGPSSLVDDAPVCGISFHEACAFVNWLTIDKKIGNVALPHEHQWETAFRLGLLEQTGHAWEWCANSLYAYDGFESFPYEGYSVPWFDNKHFVLRGGSPYTQTEIKRPGFRNFYTADKRHIFSGFRLAFT